MGFDNLSDLAKLKDGTVSFTFNEIAYSGTVIFIGYTAIGPGALSFIVTDLKTIGGIAGEIAGKELAINISLFLTKVNNRPREKVISFFAPPEPFGPILSFRVKD